MIAQNGVGGKKKKEMKEETRRHGEPQRDAEKKVLR
jgi:hypothetical protein